MIQSQVTEMIGRLVYIRIVYPHTLVYLYMDRCIGMYSYECGGCSENTRLNETPIFMVDRYHPFTCRISKKFSDASGQIQKCDFLFPSISAKK